MSWKAEMLWSELSDREGWWSKREIDWKLLAVRAIRKGGMVQTRCLDKRAGRNLNRVISLLSRVQMSECVEWGEAPGEAGRKGKSCSGKRAGRDVSNPRETPIVLNSLSLYGHDRMNKTYASPAPLRNQEGRAVFSIAGSAGRIHLKHVRSLTDRIS